MSEQFKVPEKPLPEEQQWQLALAYLRRAEISAHVLRAVLFFGAIAVAAMVLVQMQASDRGLAFLVNVASVVLALAGDLLPGQKLAIAEGESARPLQISQSERRRRGRAL